MKLPTSIIEIQQCPSDILSYLQNYIHTFDWDNDDYLTKEEAFLNQSYRYEASTEYFNDQSYFYSNVAPSTDTTAGLSVYIDYLLNTLFPDHSVFRCQVVCLKPGQNVYPHIDPRYYHAHGKRIHLPLAINDASYHVHFRPEDGYEMSFSKMSIGTITDFDNITPHAAFNYGTTDRIHIISDIVKKSTVERLRTALNGNPNATNQATVDEYYVHLKNIESRYGCKYKELKPHYLEKLREYE
jgi:hypothetical protein